VKFQRRPLRDDIQKEILGRIVDGTLPAGQRINETHLAGELGLSRTPLREAMLTLGASGFLASDMGKGFSVPPLDPGELEQITELLAALQPMALARCLPLAPTGVMELGNNLGRTRMKLGRATDGPAAGTALAHLVFNWNEVMLRDCPAPLLQEEINRLESLAARYWFAAGAKGFPVSDLLESYQELYELVRQDRRDDACRAWSSHVREFGGRAVRLLRD